jgi:hypothetical protein
MVEIMVLIWVTVHGCNPELRDSHCIISFFKHYTYQLSNNVMYLEVVYESRTVFVHVTYTKVSDFLFLILASTLFLKFCC